VVITSFCLTRLGAQPDNVRFGSEAAPQKPRPLYPRERTSALAFCWCRDGWLSTCALLQVAHMRAGSIGLLCATQMRAPHSSHWQLN